MSNVQFSVFLNRHFKVIANRLLGWQYNAVRPTSFKIFKKAKTIYKVLTRKKELVFTNNNTDSMNDSKLSTAHENSGKMFPKLGNVY